jgi:hypothetical protein
LAIDVDRHRRALPGVTRAASGITGPSSLSALATTHEWENVRAFDILLGGGSSIHDQSVGEGCEKATRPELHTVKRLSFRHMSTHCVK